MIPKIIHYCWLSNDPMPPIVSKCIESWKKLDGYELMLWDKNKFDINKYPFIKDAYEKKLYAFASDYIRLYAIYNYGGIYLDTDVECVKPIEESLLNKKYLLSKKDGQQKWVDAVVIGCEKEDETIGKLKKYYEENIICKPFDVNSIEIMDVILGKILENEVIDYVPNDFLVAHQKHIKNITENTYFYHYCLGGWIKNIIKEELKNKNK